MIRTASTFENLLDASPTQMLDRPGATPHCGTRMQLFFLARLSRQRDPVEYMRYQPNLSLLLLPSASFRNPGGRVKLRTRCPNPPATLPKLIHGTHLF